MEPSPFSICCVLSCWAHFQLSLCTWSRWLLAEPTHPLQPFPPGGLWLAWSSHVVISQPITVAQRALVCQLGSCAHSWDQGGEFRLFQVKGIKWDYSEMGSSTPQGGYAGQIKLHHKVLTSLVRAPQHLLEEEERREDSQLGCISLNEFLSLLWERVTSQATRSRKCPLQELPRPLPQGGFHPIGGWNAKDTLPLKGDRSFFQVADVISSLSY